MKKLNVQKESKNFREQANAGKLRVCKTWVYIIRLTHLSTKQIALNSQFIKIQILTMTFTMLDFASKVRKSYIELDQAGILINSGVLQLNALFLIFLLPQYAGFFLMLGFWQIFLPYQAQSRF